MRKNLWYKINKEKKRKKSRQEHERGQLEKTLIVKKDTELEAYTVTVQRRRAVGWREIYQERCRKGWLNS